MATEEQLKMIMSELVAQTIATVLEKMQEDKAKDKSREEEAEGGNRKRRVLDEKFQKRIKEFSGQQGDWREWHFKFKNQMKLQKIELWKAMNETEAKKDEWGKGEVAMEYGEKMEDWSMELYELLCESMGGEALIKVQNVEENDGLEAWRRIFRSFNPTTPAKALQVMVDIVKPPKIEKDAEVETMMEKWELKVGMAAKDFGKDLQLSEKMKVAIATSMMPSTIQEMIFQHAENLEDFKAFKEKVSSLVSNRVAVERVPMDIGSMQEGQEGYWREALWYEPQVDWLGKGKGKGKGKGVCFNCGLPGHIARDCQKGGGKGKGKDAGGKGDGKGKGKQQWGQKGPCYRCGKMGHIARDCRVSIAEIEHENHEDEDPDLGGICWLNQVECEVDVDMCYPCGPKSDRKIMTRNRFDALNDVYELDVFGEREAVEEDDEGYVEDSLIGKGTIGKEDREAARKKGKMKKVKKWKKLEINEVTRAELNAVEERGKKIKVTIDSGAEDSVWPTNYVEDWKNVAETEQSRLGKGFVVANGSRIENNGCLKVMFKNKEEEKKGMAFHVTDVKKPLAAVCKIVEKGNRVCFGPKPEDCYIMNLITQERTMMRREKGQYVIEFEYEEVKPRMKERTASGFTRPE